MIVTGGADNKINSLLDRGNMALEDRDWESASKFFEEVLNNDSKNAQAYVGKALAAEQAQTLHKFVLKILLARTHFRRNAELNAGSRARAGDPAAVYSARIRG